MENLHIPLITSKELFFQQKINMNFKIKKNDIKKKKIFIVINN